MDYQILFVVIIGSLLLAAKLAWNAKRENVALILSILAWIVLLGLILNS